MSLKSFNKLSPEHQKVIVESIPAWTKSMDDVFLGNFLYHSLLEGLWGKTVGKKICGIVVLKEDFSKCAVGRGFLRNLLWVVDGFFYYLVAAVAMAGTMKWQRLGDLVAGTVVVRDKKR